ncbi:cytochrome P450 [Actinopolymorpha pittospori]|uniref:Cytochrome P450 n=1 Tax=Actinopolymorpha pittospori TaxID=648752 RepID=A0A927MWK4_9ACTN|nr:cytochrome P450 [Actinopolymorpha pittospori]MBE1608241.1 cytochrome P450 [Actinopolymorpha pittospori]
MAETVPAAAEVPELPMSRSCPFDPPEQLAQLREEQPITPLRYQDGRAGWLVTSYAIARTILADPRFSRKNELQHLPKPFKLTGLTREPAQPGFFLGMDPPEHTRYRRQLTAHFTVRRMRQLEPRIARITEEHLDAMERHGPPVDLVSEFALPIPSLVICELLGVPYEDRGRFQGYTRRLLSLESTPDETVAARDALCDYLDELVARKRSEPGDDLVTTLLAGADLDDDEVAGVGVLLLVAGHETTANMLGLGTFALLRHPDQLTALRADPSLMEHAVEELLRYLTIVHLGPTRAALEDVEISGRVIHAGDPVTISLSEANRDPERFENGEELDVHHSATGHLAFGHGIHQCLGQQLARIEMRIGYAALLRRFPGLRLAVAPEDVRMRTDMSIYGVHNLPVAW